MSPTADEAYVVANRVRLLRSQSVGPFVLTEAPVDARVYGRFFHPDAEALVCYGREVALDALEILRGDAKADVVALVDADFDRIERVEPNPDVVVTDHHDLECMILESPAWDKMKLLHSTSKTAAFESVHGDILRALLRAAAPLGALRLVSRSGLGLDFNGVKFSRFTDRTSLIVDIDRMVREVANNSQRHDLDVRAISADVANVMAAGHDPWELCCGHDLIGMLGLGLRTAFGSSPLTTVSDSALGQKVELAYERAHFEKTGMYQRIRAWERRAGLPVLSS